jgi:hypothetical protein
MVLKEKNIFNSSFHESNDKLTSLIYQYRQNRALTSVMTDFSFKVNSIAKDCVTPVAYVLNYFYQLLKIEC